MEEEKSEDEKKKDDTGVEERWNRGGTSMTRKRPRKVSAI